MRLTNGAPELPLSVLRAAYADGWFPMGERGTRLIEWFSPDPRGILPLTGFHVPARLGRTLRAGRFEIRIDAAFAEVMARCAERDDTWISDVIKESYTALHQEGDAHSVECWRERGIPWTIVRLSGDGRCVPGERLCVPGQGRRAGDRERPVWTHPCPPGPSTRPSDRRARSPGKAG